MRQAVQTIDAQNGSGNLYSVVQQEVELGAQALRRQKADASVTSFQNRYASSGGTFALRTSVFLP
jgi:hypothetical protein